MDLKALLLEAKQKVPPVLQVLHCGDETMLDIGGERPWAGTATSRRAAEGPGLRPAPSAPVAPGSRGGSCLPQGCCCLAVRAARCCGSGGRHWCKPSAAGVGGLLSCCGTAPPDLLPLVADERGCAFCGGLGHRITDCPKLEAMQTKQVSNIGRKDYLAHSSMDF